MRVLGDPSLRQGSVDVRGLSDGLQHVERAKGVDLEVVPRVGDARGHGDWRGAERFRREAEVVALQSRSPQMFKMLLVVEVAR